MLLSTLDYFIFLPIVFILYYLIPSKFRWILILLSSIVFYLIGGLTTVAVPIVIVLATYFSAIFIEKSDTENKKKLFYYLGLFVNLGLLIFFKYVNFFILTITDGINLIRSTDSGEMANTVDPVLLNLIIPLGISYTTFQAIGYLIEIKRESHKAEKNLGFFATYLMFFPKLLSGPIDRAHDFLPQLRIEHKFNYELISKGLKRILWGLFLKLVVANRLALYTSAVFDFAEYHSGITLLFASLLFTLQLFADFAGYTEMAIGSANLLGFKLTENFNLPFMAKSITELWRRWHISLTTWVNDYIYTPIVIAKRDWNKSAVVFAGMVTFLILGFWHGASWNFIIFGFLHGLILAIEFLTKKRRKKIIKKIPGWLNSGLGMIYAFLYFSFTCIFFKARTAEDAIYIVKKIFTDFDSSLYTGDIGIFAFSLMAIFILFIQGYVSAFYPKYKLLNNSSKFVRLLTIVLLIIYIVSFGVFDGSQFIYYQF